AARDENDIDVVRIVWQTGGQSACALDTSVTQSLFERRVSDQHVYVALDEFGNSRRIAFDGDEVNVRALHRANDARADATCAADNKMVVQLAHFTLTTTFAKRRQPFRLNDGLCCARQNLENC